MKVIFVENNNKIAKHQALTKELDITGAKTKIVNGQNSLKELISHEKPDLVIIDDRFPGLRSTTTLDYLHKLKETLVIFIKRINGVKEITELVYSANGCEEKCLSHDELLRRLRTYRVTNNNIAAKFIS